METLWISNIAATTTDEELMALVNKYAPDLDCVKVQRVEGDGSRPAAQLWFAHKNIDSSSPDSLPGDANAIGSVLDSLKKLSRRLDGLYWKGRALSSSTTVFEDPR